MRQTTRDLFQDATAASYARVYEALSDLRELFHRAGRFDDSNAKLDEVVKLLATYVAYRRRLVSLFPDGDERSLIPSLQRAFAEASKLPCYHTHDGLPIFGRRPVLALKEGDEELARKLVSLVREAVDVAFHHKEIGKPFDIVNEAFGHFVRDNFRNNTEDAQFMTPPEVVDFMAEIALCDLEREDKGASGPFVMADPTCGVGSFLTAFYRKAIQRKSFRKRHIKLVGQDKVDRMVRLSVVNMALFESLDHEVTAGNSLGREAPISAYNGGVDLILTNPPFGARFAPSEIAQYGPQNFPLFFPVLQKCAALDSELLFVDRDLALLKDGGRLLIIVPDGVVSAKGTAAMLRQRLRGTAELRGVIELPSVTFAQAGTRTRTAILYIVKQNSGRPVSSRIFFGSSEDLGFEVSSRKGVPVKVSSGKNDLSAIAASYEKHTALESDARPQVLSDSPSCVSVGYPEAIDDTWTPSHYSAKRYRALASLDQRRNLRLVPLADLVEFVADSRGTRRWAKNRLFISVLHVLGEGMLDVDSMLGYEPVTPGVPVKPGDILLSKINPRIPRALVVPDIDRQLLCSTEFEVMIPRNGEDPYLIAFLLLSAPVQAQIQSLTSGTSASHNRVRTEDLGKVALPVPAPGSSASEKVSALVGEYRDNLRRMFEDSWRLAALRRDGEKFLSGR